MAPELIFICNIMKRRILLDRRPFSHRSPQHGTMD